MNTTTAHIIANREIGMTECGRMVDYHDVTDATPWGMSGSKTDVAIWDNDTPELGQILCHKCMEAYNDMSERLTITEARIIATTGEIHDVVKISTETVRRIVDVLAGSDWRRVDDATAHTIALEELRFRERYGY